MRSNIFPPKFPVSIAQPSGKKPATFGSRAKIFENRVYNSLVPEILENEEETETREIETTVDHVTGLAVRHCEGQRGFLNWQAGALVTEQRLIPISVYSSSCSWQPVSLFRLLGYGWSREEAITNALRNPHGRNGR